MCGRRHARRGKALEWLQRVRIGRQPLRRRQRGFERIALSHRKIEQGGHHDATQRRVVGFRSLGLAVAGALERVEALGDCRQVDRGRRTFSRRRRFDAVHLGGELLRTARATRRTIFPARRSVRPRRDPPLVWPAWLRGPRHVRQAHRRWPRSPAALRRAEREASPASSRPRSRAQPPRRPRSARPPRARSPLLASQADISRRAVSQG